MTKQLPNLQTLLICIRKKREKLKMTQTEVANLLGRKQSTYNKIENGQHQLTYEEFTSLLSILDLNVETILMDCNTCTRKNASSIGETKSESLNTAEVKEELIKILNKLG